MNRLTNSNCYSDIADAVRAKLDVQDTFTPAQLTAAIDSIQQGPDLIRDIKHLVCPTWEKNQPLPAGAECSITLNQGRSNSTHYLYLPKMAALDQYTYKNIPEGYDKVLIAGYWDSSNNNYVFWVFFSNTEIGAVTHLQNIPIPIDGSWYTSNAITPDISASGDITCQSFVGGATFPCDTWGGEAIYFSSYDIKDTNGNMVLAKNCDVTDFMIERQEVE